MKKKKVIKSIPLTADTLGSYAKTDDVAQLKKMNSEMLKSLIKQSEMINTLLERISELQTELYGPLEPNEEKKEDDSFLYPGLN